jgi:ring-1,2-phenylacetyl-CoA epoxidase subunit PaaC
MASRTSDVATTVDLQTVADGCLLLSHRLSEWTSNAPTMEEDVAVANIALDLLGQARGLLGRLGDEDQLAYFRDAGEFRNPLICELPNGDFGQTMLRQLFVDIWLADVWRSLATHDDEVVRGLAEKATKENAYHYRHSSAWVVRLGDGTRESQQRMLAALDLLWPFRGEIATPGWHDQVTVVLTEATLPVPDAQAWSQLGGTEGRHTEHLGYLLAEMQSLARAHPGATW